jgi:SAM-dependent methyltransferase
MRSSEGERDYVSVVYSEKERPLTKYPDQLARYLVNRYGLSGGKKILDLGCGRGEFLRGFIRCGLEGHGTDQSLKARELCPEATIIQTDLEGNTVPFGDDSFDYVFCKSVLEHFYYPEKIVQEIFRILRPGGMAITMVPDWKSTRNISFYDDYTHRTPFTLISLRDIFFIHGFNSVCVELFRQLPILWNMPWLSPISKLTALLMPNALSSRSKFVRFSKEIMLLCTARKP